jgi:hypothetical protein
MVLAILNGKKTQTRRICKNESAKCPYGQIGDILWVRETHYIVNKPHWIDLPHKKMADGNVCYYAASFDRSTGALSKKPSIFMPKEACRLRLKITNVRLEKLHSISEDDCIKEGILAQVFPPKTSGLKPITWYYNYWQKEHSTIYPYVSYSSLWESINGKDSWNENPNVWVVDFEVIS